MSRNSQRSTIKSKTVMKCDLLNDRDLVISTAHSSSQCAPLVTACYH